MNLSPLAPPPVPAGPNGPLWVGLHGSARGLAIAETARTHAGPVLLVAATAQSLQRIEDELHFYAPAELPLLPFPDGECLPYDQFSPHPDLVSQRLEALYRLPRLDRGIVLLTAATLMQRLVPRDYLLSHSLVLAAGEPLALDRFRKDLARASYQAVSQVMQPGEFAVRGGLIDLFPAGSDTPYRIELFDDRIESIRAFDAETQRSIGTLERVRLLPARETPVTEAGIQQFRGRFRERFEGDPQRAPVYREVSRGLAPPGIEQYLPLFFEQTATLFDYLPDATLVITEQDAADAARRFEAETADRYERLRHDPERPLLRPAELYLGAAAAQDRLADRPLITLAPAGEAGPDETAAVRFDTRAPPELPVRLKSEQPYGVLIEWLRAYPGRCLLAAETPGRRETLKALLRDHDLRPEACAGFREFLAGDSRLALTVAELERGLLLNDPPLAVITEPQLYGERAAQRRARRVPRRDLESIIQDLGQLRAGDPVVHEDHGVGRYRGLAIIDVGDGPSEFLALEYADGDKLYVPVADLGRIGRYTGTDPEHAPLHKLGGEAWEKAKARAREKAHDAAAELLEVEALRAAHPGHAFAPRDDQYHAFAEEFPFEETPDQARVIDEVLADMESGRPMDRLVCGDVGFGKTEVAMRAAFLAAHGGRQVVVLAPTTLLAQQHFQNFRDRFADYPFRIELLSRFRSVAEQSAVLADLRAGTIDIVIGTHRLLQQDVDFRRLGLLILDEEHRFGVRQKERLKRLRAETDVLALTATPLPRTLNMALAGLRDVSIIATPPVARLAIKTFVCEWNEALAREAVLREVRRGGQVYFLYNDVRTIERMQGELRALVPEAEIRIAHGQMPERELERVMLDFYHQRFQILLCSTIIESGIDVPSANTIIIYRADRFGLAQLHQLRGRVGRSHHRAYAYLVVPGGAALSGDARKRLDALASLEELGAGFALATHDLEIRGAGELLGEAQSGQIDEIGFSLYAEFLRRAVASLRTGAAAAEPSPASEINLHVPALLPAEYVEDVHTRLVLYKRIAGARSDEALEELMGELLDRFGPLPDAARRLFEITRLRLKTSALGIRRIEAGPRGARVEFIEQPAVAPEAIIRLLQAQPRRYRLDGPNRLRVMDEMPDGDARHRVIAELVAALA